MKESAKAHIALIISGMLFGANYWIAKSLMPEYMQPMQVVFVRGLATVLLFWMTALIMKDRAVEKKDHLILALCGLTGITINQAFFFIGLNLTSPVDTALIHSGSPVIVLLLSAVISGERTGKSKISGIIMGAAGSVLLVLQGNFSEGGSNHLLGNTLIFLNIVSYSLYLVMIKPLMARYSVLTVMKWVFLYGFIFVLPFCYNGIPELSFRNFSAYAWFALTYIVIGTTFITYLLTTFSLKTVSAGVAGYYIYMQPVIAAGAGIMLFNERLTFPKIIAAALVFSGVFLVNRNTTIRKGA